MPHKVVHHYHNIELIPPPLRRQPNATEKLKEMEVKRKGKGVMIL